MSSFVARYKQEWDELESLVRRARKGRGRLAVAERQRLDELYRRTTIHLARVTTSGDDPALAEYLNGLTAAAHSVIYLPPGESAVRKLRLFVAEGFARAVARHWPQHLISALLVLGGGAAGYFAAGVDPVVTHALWPAEDPRQPGSMAEQLRSALRSGREEDGGGKFLFASFLFQHNLKVSLLAMATGVLAAAPPVLLMFYNGMQLGVFVAIHHQAEIRAEMWAWILPHGVTELGAIILCGGVGLMLGQAVVRPGELSRTESLRQAGREAARIALGAAGMLVLAAIIESYVRQSHWSTGARLAFAAATFAFWALYLLLGGIRERQARAAATRLAGAEAAARTWPREAGDGAAPDRRRSGLAQDARSRETLAAGRSATAGSAAVVRRID